MFHSFSGQNTELLLDYCQKLLDKFNYPWEMMPLMYAILKNANNVEEAERRIDEGKQFVTIKKKNIILLS